MKQHISNTIYHFKKITLRIMMKSLILSTLFFLQSCSKKKEIMAEQPETSENASQISLTELQYKNAGISIGTAAEQSISAITQVNGTIDVPPQAMASVSATSAGYIKKLKFLPGHHVHRGEVLATLEDPQIVQLQQDYLLSKSNLSYAEKDYARQQKLNLTKSSSDKTMQMAQTEVSNQAIMRKSLEEKLKLIGINPSKLNANNIQRGIAVVSPISGYIGLVNVNIGQYVMPSDKLFEIVNTDDLHLSLKVFEKDLDKIAIGQMVYGYTNQNPSKKYKAQIFLIGKEFSPDKSVFVHCHFIGSMPNIIPGTFMNAEIESSPRTSFSVDEDAVVTWENKQYLFEEIKPKTYKMYPVKIGATENKRTEILEPVMINPNKKFVLKGAYSLLMALKNVEE